MRNIVNRIEEVTVNRIEQQKEKRKYKNTCANMCFEVRHCLYFQLDHNFRSL